MQTNSRAMLHRRHSYLRCNCIRTKSYNDRRQSNETQYNNSIILVWTIITTFCNIILTTELERARPWRIEKFEKKNHETSLRTRSKLS